jgi:hypothetical protein
VTEPHQTVRPATTEPPWYHRVPRILWLAIGTALLAELVVAWLTDGTPDIGIWKSFAESAQRVGPIDIYSLSVDGPDRAGLMVYNHPPLIGWWLQVVNGATVIGIPFAFMIRLPSVLAHAATALLVFEVLRVRVPAITASRSGVLVALSPVLLTIAGFHGNNDPVMAMLTIAAVWLLVDRRHPALAGLAFALALSIKIPVPAIAAPLLLVAAWKLGRRDLLQFLLGTVPVALVLWLPVVALAGRGFVSHVLGYNGSGFPRQWGPYKFAEFIGVPDGILNFYSGPGTYLVLALAALLPAWLVLRTPAQAPAALGLCVSLFLLISPGWAPQYTSWAAAAVFFIEFWTATAFTLVAGTVYAVLYTWWAGWGMWKYAYVTTLTKGQMAVLGAAWLALAPCVVVGLRLLRRSDVPPVAAGVPSYAAPPAQPSAGPPAT